MNKYKILSYLWGFLMILFVVINLEGLNESYVRNSLNGQVFNYLIESAVTIVIIMVMFGVLMFLSEKADTFN